MLLIGIVVIALALLMLVPMAAERLARMMFGL
jgi:hypothetical protein